MSALIHWSTCLALASVTGCGADPQLVPYTLQLHAERPDASPLAGVRFWVEGRELPPTGDDGRATSAFNGHEGDELRVTALCPVGHRGPLEPRTIKLVRATAPGSTQASPLQLTWRCVPEQTRAALVVRAQLGNTPLAVPIVVDGRIVGQTDAHGVAHVLLRSAANTSVQARLDTSARPELIPRDPVRVFDLDGGDTILLFDQGFDAQKHVSHRAPTRPVHPRIPMRIE